tara:strand:- start:10 stop:348 length:339 start_codon:yes stop_codon:yes gene_type:complete
MLIKARTRKGVQNFRRAGHSFDFNLQTYEVTEEELERIKGEPMIDIVEFDVAEGEDNEDEGVDGDAGTDEPWTKESLMKLSKPELQALAEENEIDPEQNKSELADELLEELA